MGESERLLRWYDHHARDLPWRQSTDAYPVWVSEIMLQQTRVGTVIPYFLRFLKEFPTVFELAAAPTDQVLALWSGLGYYRRARQMHAAAKVVADQGGEFPATSRGLRSLPGIGPYTAAAVASIAFGEVVPVVDGNVERLISRRLALQEPPRSKAGKTEITEAAAKLLDTRRPGDSNQAMMELGATLCLPAQPRCAPCPLAAGCQARERRETHLFPRPSAKKPTRKMRRRVAVVLDAGRILLFRRPQDSSLLAGTWELPWVDLTPATAEALSTTQAKLQERYGGRWELAPVAVAVRHSITFRALTLEVHRGRLRGGAVVAEGPEAGWFEPGELQGLPLSSQVFKVLEKVGVLPSGRGGVAAPGEDEPSDQLLIELPQALGDEVGEDRQQP